MMENLNAKAKPVSKTQIPTQLVDWMKKQGVNVSNSKFAALIAIDKNIYAGTLITQDQHVMKYLIDLENPEDTILNDLTARPPSRPPQSILLT